MNKSEEIRSFLKLLSIEYRSMQGNYPHGIEYIPYVVSLSSHRVCYAFVVWLAPEECDDVLFHGFAYLVRSTKPFLVSTNVTKFFRNFGEYDDADAVDFYETSRRAFADLNELFTPEQYKRLCELVEQ